MNTMHSESTEGVMHLLIFLVIEKTLKIQLTKKHDYTQLRFVNFIASTQFKMFWLE